MARLFFLFFTFLYYPAEVTIALDSDRDHPAIVDARDIEIDFATGRWTYRGDVTVEQGTLHMTADEIHLFFDDDVLQRAVAHGQPAVFRQQPEGRDHLIRGRAQTIEINEIENIATFSGNARLQQDRDTITGDIIVYHMETEKLTVRGNVSIPGKTTRSTSTATTNTTNDISELSARPRIVIQPQAGATTGESAKLSPESTDLLTAIVVDSGPTARPKANQNAVEKKLEFSDDSLKFQAARVIGAGTAAYNEPGAEATLLGGLSGQMPVKVLELRNSWARVIIPSGINVWVFASYIAQDRDGQSRVQGRGVRARWMPSTDSRIVGVLAHGEAVHVLATQNLWKQISLPPSIAAWVPTSQLEIVKDINQEWRSDWQTQTEVFPTTGN
jgi:lipopolysaccharide export system protein LptA